ncbi:Phosphatidylethanolamine-binding protein [Pleurostoma richardsiae]|uniref:Phosphatidylethanolamine-binding protein n=1 Tax=Pleurostoma richardsiae TaxID=41990 RepID=A0AA38VL05_9PEZI|nr:Phosphatidylethanolamine-binding protein [Pleurostoma richardsiae]
MLGLRGVVLLALLQPLIFPGASAFPHEQKVLEFLGHEKNDKTAHNVIHELKKAEIIPTVIDEFIPALLVDAEWSDDEYASLGNTLKPKQLQETPSIKLTPIAESAFGLSDSNLTYAVTLTDPDAPSRDDPKWAEMCHWIATGLSISSSSADVGSRSDAEVGVMPLKDIMPYKPPGPPAKTGKHRYVFLIFAPANGTTESLNLTKPDDRQHWGTGKERHGVRDWALDNGLVPVAANFIYAQNKKQ